MTELEIISRKEAIGRGLSRFFTGKKCRRGHLSERYTVSGNCIDCRYDMDSPIDELQITPEHEKKRKSKERARIWYQNNKELTKSRARVWKEENRDRVRELASSYDRRLYSSGLGKTIRFMRDSIRRCLVNKTDRTEVILGYTKEELMTHLENQFEDGMSWSNHGEWHIDHVIPLSWFIKAGVNDPRVINKLNNLRPLWAYENQSRWRP